MSLRSSFAGIFGTVWDRVRVAERDVEAAEDAAEHKIGRELHAAVALAKRIERAIFNQEEKEIEMVPQAIQDLIDKIKATLAAHEDLQTGCAAKDQQIAALTSSEQAKDNEIATLTQHLADANAEISDTQAALAAIVPIPVVVSPVVVEPPAPTTNPATGAAT